MPPVGIGIRGVVGLSAAASTPCAGLGRWLGVRQPLASKMGASVNHGTHEAADICTLVMQTYLATVGVAFDGFL
jgi:hypothetical protein